MYDELVKKLNKLTDDDSRHDYGVGHYWNACEEALDAIEDLQARVEKLQAPIMEVAKVVPGESRIETACRIIREHENRCPGPAQKPNDE